jgi:SAM-dependent methyltransferase
MGSPWDDHLKDNLALWNARVPVHAGAAFYDLAGFKAGASSLNALERDCVGDVRGKRLLHLQCHFGLDTLSWARLGAAVVGVDFSDAAVALARSLAAELSLPARFVNCNVYDTRAHLAETFDIVFTSYGAICWLPDLTPWARVIRDSLAPGGRFVLVEFHPFVWMSQTGPDLKVRYSYFNTGAITETPAGTYADPGHPIQLREHGWNHPMGEVVNALIDAGLTIDRLEEHSGSPYNTFPNLVRGADGLFSFAEAPGLVPMLFSLQASAPRG